MFAIIRTAGKQYRVAQGDTIRFARMSAEPGDAFETDQVLAIGGEESELKFGSPVIAGAKVQGTILQHGKDKKIIVFKRKRRKTYRRKYGHRQGHTLVKIDKISAKEVSVKKAEPKKAVTGKVAPKKVVSKKAVAK
ncbi:MAG TPA: 50S ribosomal protein L21 [Deltaproteobacteria bacterium]|nr:50S ribosomal protein L21 [Deltaproteobacteria bacterium]